MHRVGGRMSDEDKAEPAKGVMGNLPATRPTRMARRRDGDPVSRAEEAPRRSGAKSRPKAASSKPTRATPKATGKPVRAKGKAASKPTRATPKAIGKPATRAKSQAKATAKPKSSAK